MNIETTKELKDALRNGQYAWPGGYPMYFIADDGAALSFESVKENYRLVLSSTRHKMRDGWGVIAVDINWEDNQLICAHSGERIQSAYGEGC